MTISNPVFIIFSFFSIPALIFTLFKNSRLQKKIRLRIYLRSICNSLAWIFLCLSLSGFSWGSYTVPVLKNSHAVSMVFDISNSMQTKDCDDLTRLESASLYAKELLKKMNGIPVSVVAVKGKAMTVIPLTQDYSTIESFLDVISPKLMTFPGSAIADGILEAKQSFPKNFSFAQNIWVFTDCEENSQSENSFDFAFEECLKNGISVKIIGFGSENESEILSGDGKTLVKSALRSKNISEIIEKTNSKFNVFKSNAKITFNKYFEKGSAFKLLNSIQNSDSNSFFTTYETKILPRYKFFLFFAFLFFIAGFLFSELNLKKFNFKKKSKSLNKKISGTLIFLIFSLFFTGCSKNFSSSLKTLSASIEYQKQNYQKAAGEFSEVLEDSQKNEQNEISKMYTIYNLATVYAQIGETNAAISKFSEISSDFPKNLRYAAYYNSGVAYFKNADYELAIDSFKKAIKVDNSKIEAKINLELSVSLFESESKQNESQVLPSAENKENEILENKIFERIKEQDRQKWKNSMQTEISDYSNDY